MSATLGHILNEYLNNTAFLAILKKNSKTWPEVLSWKNKDINAVYFSTLVRVKREGQFWLFHFVRARSLDFYPDNGGSILADLYKELIVEVHIGQEFLKLPEVGSLPEHLMPQLDSDQSEEKDRLRKIYTYLPQS